jgi:hypothetical protein
MENTIFKANCLKLYRKNKKNIVEFLSKIIYTKKKNFDAYITQQIINYLNFEDILKIYS